MSKRSWSIGRWVGKNLIKSALIALAFLIAIAAQPGTALAVLGVYFCWRLLLSGETEERPENTYPRPGAPSAHWQHDKRFEWDVVGESNHQQILAILAGKHGNSSAKAKHTVTLTPYSTNPHDEMAVAVFIDNHAIGHLSRADARKHRKSLLQAGLQQESISCQGIIVGGGKSSDGKKFFYGVKLDLPGEPEN